MKIGELAAATGTPVETIRYYERMGLLGEPARTSANYRVYTDAQTQRLAFIRRCRTLDMSLAEISELLRFVDAPDTDCATVNALLDEHIVHVRTRLAELRRLEHELRELRSQCEAVGDATQCGILRNLASESSTHVGSAAPQQPQPDAHIHGFDVHPRNPKSARRRSQATSQATGRR